MSASLTVTETAQASAAKPHSLRRVLLYGGATVGVAVGLERALGFLSTMLAARVGGPGMFGAYAVTLATAGTIAAYAGAGIGTTATRFSGEYTPESEGYRRFIRALIVVGVASALLAAAMMLAGAEPLARLVLRNEGLAPALRVAAISAGAIILLECCRGLLMGQQKFQSLVVISLISGVGLLVVLPLAAKLSVVMMIAGQAAVALICVLTCFVLAKRFGIWPAKAQNPDAGPGIKRVFTFGLVQFSAVAGISIASWWVASLVARSDATLAQMGWYAIANQFRGLAILAPGLCTQVGYALLTDESGFKYGGAGRVMLTNSLLVTLLAILACGLGIVVAPWLVLVVYGSSYAGAEVPILILLATGIVHMSSGPAAQRLSIVGLRTLGIINAAWALLLAGLAIWLVPVAGATGAALAFFLSHALSNALVVICLARLRELPRGYVGLLIITTIGSMALVGVGYWRSLAPARVIPATVVLGGVWLVTSLVIWLIGQRANSFSSWSSRLVSSP